MRHDPAILKAGCLAYLDTPFHGLVPCKVVRVYRAPDLILGLEMQRVDVKVTAERGAYKRNEICRGWHPRVVVPRSAVYRPRGSFYPRIGAYEIVEG